MSDNPNSAGQVKPNRETPAIRHRAEAKPGSPWPEWQAQLGRPPERRKIVLATKGEKDV